MNPFNPYMYQNYLQNAMNQMPAQMQSAPAGIAGKYVNDFGEVTANDVPMNGSPAIFARVDRSEIQMREWSPNGQIITTVYKAVTPMNEPAPDQTGFDIKTELLEPILARISELEAKLEQKEVEND